MFRAKKSLAQNFLRRRPALAAMIAAARLKPGELVLEIGPGEGILTAALLETGARVVAVEKDDRLIGFLQNKFSSAIKNKQLILIHDDILNFDLNFSLLALRFKLIANIPYYLTGQLLRQFLTSDHQPTLMVLMLQKEVAERIVAQDGREGILSISVKAYGEPRYRQTVAARHFRPRPKVDSAIVLIDKINKDNFRTVSEEKFFTLLKRGFAGKRKMLKNNLPHRQAGLGTTEEILARCQISTAARAENLTLNQWLCLAREVQS